MLIFSHETVEHSSRLYPGYQPQPRSQESLVLEFYFQVIPEIGNEAGCVKINFYKEIENTCEAGTER